MVSDRIPYGRFVVMAPRPVSEFLWELDAWTIYDAEKLLSQLHEETLCGVIDMNTEIVESQPIRHFWINYPNRDGVNFFPHTADDILAIMDARGLGGTFDPKDGKYFIAGYSLAYTLANLITRKPSTKMGRGTSFNDNIRIIREAENNG